MVWPGVTRAGAVNDTIIQSVDFYPTLLEMLGLAMPEGQLCDGRSFVPALRGRPHDRGPLFCHFPHYTPKTGAIPSCYVRVGDWKLIRLFCDNEDQSDRFELYNLAEDVSERHDLAEQRPEKVQELNPLIDRFLAETKAVVPTANPRYRQSIAGWWPLRECTLSLEDGVFRVQSTGGDPSITTEDVPDGRGPLTLEFRLKSDGRGAVQVFWTAGKEKTFKRDRSVTLDVEHDGQWHSYVVALPVAGPLRSLRLDPSTGPGEIRLAGLRLKDAAGQVVSAWGAGK